MKIKEAEFPEWFDLVKVGGKKLNPELKSALLHIKCGYKTIFDECFKPSPSLHRIWIAEGDLLKSLELVQSVLKK